MPPDRYNMKGHSVLNLLNKLSRLLHSRILLEEIFCVSELIQIWPETNKSKFVGLQKSWKIHCTKKHENFKVLHKKCILWFQEKVFLTADTLQSEVDQLQTEGENMGRTDDQRPGSPSMEVKVTEMNERKLTLQIQVGCHWY